MNVVNIGDIANQRFAEHLEQKRRDLVNGAGGFTPTNEISVALDGYMDFCSRKDMWVNMPIPLAGQWTGGTQRYTLYTTYAASEFGAVNHPIILKGHRTPGVFFMLVGHGLMPPDLTAEVWENVDVVDDLTALFQDACGTTGDGTLPDVSMVPIGLAQILHTTGWIMLEPARFEQDGARMVHLGFIKDNEYYFMVVDIKTANDECNAWMKRAEEHRAQMKAVEEAAIGRGNL